MKKRMFLVLAFLHLSACSSIQKNASKPKDVLDFTQNREQAQAYWDSLEKVKPQYPQELEDKGIAGCSRFKITINQEGKTVDVEFIESFPEGMFIDSAKSVIGHWTWKPTQENAQRLAIKRILQFDFYIPNAKNFQQAKQFCAS